MLSGRRAMLAAVLAVGVLLAGGAAAALFGSWELAVIALLALQGIAVAVGALLYRRAGSLLRLAQREAKRRAVMERRLRGWPDPLTAMELEDALQRTVVLSRNQSNARLDLIEEGLKQAGKQLGSLVNQEIRDATKASSQFSVTETNALLQLHQRIRLDGAVPLLAGWAISPSGVLQIIDTALSRDCRMIVEFGSGASTLYLAAALADRSGVRLVSLDHDRGFAARTREVLDQHGLSERVDVRFAPLVETQVDGWTGKWYDASTFADLVNIDMLVIDGPPKATGSLARYPAIPLLKDSLAAECVIILDDAKRDDERASIKLWLRDGAFQRQWSSSNEQAVLLYARAHGTRAD